MLRLRFTGEHRLSSMTEAYVNIQADPLRNFSEAIFRALDMSEADARTQTDMLIWANLRGIDSHGVLRIPRYAAWLQQGEMNPQPKMATVSSTPACRVLDTDQAPGGVAMAHAMNEAISVAKQCGIGWVIARRTTHAGPAGYFATMAAERSMAGITIITSRPNMAYHGARAAGLATSPIAIAVPGSDGPLMFDMATSSIALGSIMQARATGTELPENVALTKDGNPTRDPDEAAIPMPLAGPKGSGLSLLFECLLGVLAEHPLLATTLTGELTIHSQNGLCAAIDIAAFTSSDDYQRRIAELGGALKALPPASADQAVRLPGERGDAIRRERESSGIPIPAAVRDRLVSVAGSLGVDPPSDF